MTSNMVAHLVGFAALIALFGGANALESAQVRAAVRQYWILMGYYENDRGFERVPRALGPYPTREMCRLAGKDLVPNDRRFWTAAERAEGEARDKKEADELAAYLKTAKRDKGGWVRLPDGNYVHVHEDGEVDGMSTVSSGAMMASPSPPVAITGCLVQE